MNDILRILHAQLAELEFVSSELEAPSIEAKYYSAPIVIEREDPIDEPKTIRSPQGPLHLDYFSESKEVKHEDIALDSIHESKRLPEVTPHQLTPVITDSEEPIVAVVAGTSEQPSPLAVPDVTRPESPMAADTLDLHFAKPGTYKEIEEPKWGAKPRAIAANESIVAGLYRYGLMGSLKRLIGEPCAQKRTEQSYELRSYK